MYNVVLCEDEKVFAENQEKICREILAKLNIDYTIRVFSSGADFLRAFAGGEMRCDLILLDIVMDGVELARKIRERDEEAAIVFITSDSGHALEGYDVNALHYLLKPLDAAVLERLIRADYQKRFQNSFFVFHAEAGSVKYRAAIRDILYLEAESRRVKVVLTDRTLYYHGKLGDLLEELPCEKGQFVRCYRTIAANIGKVRELTRQSAILVSGEEVPVSRNYADEVQKAFVSRQLRG